MKRLPLVVRGATALACLLASAAGAVEMHVTTLDIHQENLGAEFTVGHFIDASSVTTNLTISGGFIVSCSEPVIPEIREGYSATQTVFGGRNVFSKAIPEPLPARRTLSNWSRIKSGSVVSCNYQVQARAVESGLNLGAGGSGVVIGGGERSENFGIPFDMLKVGDYVGPGCLY